MDFLRHCSRRTCAVIVGSVLIGCMSESATTTAEPDPASQIASGLSQTQSGLTVAHQGMTTYLAGDTAHGLAELQQGVGVMDTAVASTTSGVADIGGSAALDRCHDAVNGPLQLQQAALVDMHSGLTALNEGGASAAKGVTDTQTGLAEMDRANSKMGAAVATDCPMVVAVNPDGGVVEDAGIVPDGGVEDAGTMPDGATTDGGVVMGGGMTNGP
jgi:hypothetical protein